MTESSESADSTTKSVVTTAPTRYVDSDHRDRRLHRTLAWVGIVAGVVFTVAVIFFSGLALGRTSGGHHGWQRGYQGGQMTPGGCPMMGGGMTGPGGGMGMMAPEDKAPEMMRPGQPPAAPSPSPTVQPPSQR